MPAAPLLQHTQGRETVDQFCIPGGGEPHVWMGRHLDAIQCEQPGFLRAVASALGPH
jgi:hypothetical protein